MTDQRRALPAMATVLVTVLLVGACSSAGGPILANPTPALPTPARPAASSSASPDPRPIELPRDDGPHDRLTEWWYDTGHLLGRAANGMTRRFGFEFVVFRAERGSFPTTWASHLAITDESGDRFLYAQRSEIGGWVDYSPRNASGDPSGFDLRVSGADPRDPATLARLPWVMAGGGGHDRLEAQLSESEASVAGVASMGLTLDLVATKPPTLHDGDGWIDFGPAGSSYYVSRTALDATGSVDLDGTVYDVTGTAWFDHQWGDFISVGGGGWDWFAVNLDDGTDLTISVVRAADGSTALAYGTLVDEAGHTRHLDPDGFTVTVTDHWTSPATGARYPAGWTVTIPGEDLVIDLRPTVADQELDTRATTGVVYWEGSQHVRATRAGRSLGGEAYVELTGYAPTTRSLPASPGP